MPIIPVIIINLFIFSLQAISLQKAYEICLLSEGYGLELTELIKRSKGYMTDNFFHLAKKDNFAEETSFSCLDTCLNNWSQTKSQLVTLDEVRTLMICCVGCHTKI